MYDTISKCTKFNFYLIIADLIAIPDFVSGAMENWGLITFRETSVLYDPDFSSSGNQVQVALTTTHELAHMWFGDLGNVTECLRPLHLSLVIVDGLQIGYPENNQKFVGPILSTVQYIRGSKVNISTIMATL